ncbi:hypothetical protein [Solidesulfovibrio sp.]
MPKPMSKPKEFDLFDRPKTRRLLWLALWGACAGVVALQFFASPEPHFGFDDFPGFSALFGFVACVALILIAKALGYLLKKPTDYYDA